MHGNSFAPAGSGLKIGTAGNSGTMQSASAPGLNATTAPTIRVPLGKGWDAGLMSRDKLFLNGMYSMKSERRNLNAATKPNREPKLSRTHAPADLSAVDWQRGLRRQFGREQAFELENLGSEPFFSEYRVSNPASKSSYRVAIRGLGPGGNFCSCPDYATSELGTCKHIEFTLARLAKKRGARAAFARGYQPAFSELYLRNEGKRRVHFRAGTDCPPAVRKAAAGLFDSAHNGRLPDERLGDLDPFIAMVS